MPYDDLFILKATKEHEQIDLEKARGRFLNGSLNTEVQIISQVVEKDMSNVNVFDAVNEIICKLHNRLG